MGSGMRKCLICHKEETVDDISLIGYDAAIKNKVEELTNRLENPVIIRDDASKFKRHGLIGKGGFSRVIKVTRPPDKKYYAMKQMSKKEIKNRKLINYIKRERDILVAVNFHFVTKLLCCCIDGHSLYFVTELASCGDFETFLDNHTLDEACARFYIGQVVIALEYFHSATIMHRDIKPPNILVYSDGYIKVTDFNLARFLMFGKAFTMCGSPEYMAPEIELNVGYTFTVDWYALGAVTDEMVNRYLEKFRKEGGQVPEVEQEILAFIKALSEADPKKRLGAEGAQAIREHPFFSSINWVTLYMKLYKAPVAKPRACLLREGDFSDDELKGVPPTEDFNSFCN